MKDVVRIIKKKVATGDKVFEKLLAVHTVGEDTKVIGVNFSNKCKERLNKEMIKADLAYPVDVVLEDNDYFICNEEDKDGNKLDYLKIVITNYQELVAVDLEQWKKEHPIERKTLTDLH